MSVGPLLTIADDVYSEYSEPLTNLIFNKLQAGVQVVQLKPHLSVITEKLALMILQF